MDYLIIKQIVPVWWCDDSVITVLLKLVKYGVCNTNMAHSCANISPVSPCHHASSIYHYLPPAACSLWFPLILCLSVFSHKTNITRLCCMFCQQIYICMLLAIYLNAVYTCVQCKCIKLSNIFLLNIHYSSAGSHVSCLYGYSTSGHVTALT